MVTEGQKIIFYFPLTSAKIRAERWPEQESGGERQIGNFSVYLRPNFF